MFLGAALFASGWQCGLYGHLGASAGTATAHLLVIHRELIAAGPRGSNGCLVSTAFAVFLAAGHLSTWDAVRRRLVGVPAPAIRKTGTPGVHGPVPTRGAAATMPVATTRASPPG
ncbi:urea transporter [Streptomyces sp. NPDC060031]|uniref:urea transporter n=1 Tax=Streptomyces sp. NPDC060031 TaxID=3347043 RepID=UPI0036C46BB5